MEPPERKVEFEVVKDVSGLTFHVFKWNDEAPDNRRELRIEVECGNRLFVNSEGKIEALAYTDSDRALGEARRAALEKNLPKPRSS